VAELVGHDEDRQDDDEGQGVAEDRQDSSFERRLTGQ
jgi:hypothetical protein